MHKKILVLIKLFIALVLYFLQINLDFNESTEKFQLKSSEKYAKKRNVEKFHVKRRIG